MFDQKNTPGHKPEGIPQTHHLRRKEDTSSIAHCADQSDVFRQQLQGIYIVVAEIKPANDERRFRRRFYASLESAQRHVDRSRMNGREAHLFIGQLHIVDGDA